MIEKVFMRINNKIASGCPRLSREPVALNSNFVVLVIFSRVEIVGFVMVMVALILKLRKSLAVPSGAGRS